MVGINRCRPGARDCWLRVEDEGQRVQRKGKLCHCYWAGSVKLQGHLAWMFEKAAGCPDGQCLWSKKKRKGGWRLHRCFPGLHWAAVSYHGPPGLLWPREGDAGHFPKSQAALLGECWAHSVGGGGCSEGQRFGTCKHIWLHRCQRWPKSSVLTQQSWKTQKYKPVENIKTQVPSPEPGSDLFRLVPGRG